MLVGISFGMPRQSRELKAASAQIETQHGSAIGTVRTSGFYFRQKVAGKDVDGLATLKKFQTAWKTALENYARYPFASGMKLLPAALVEKFLVVNQEFKDNQAKVWLDWVDDEYPLWKASAPERMGSFYDETDFPSQQDCMARFKCEVTAVPMTEAEQIKRTAMISPNMATLMETTFKQGFDQAQEAAFKDLLAPIESIVSTLSKDKGKIHDSMIGNLIKIIDLIPALNLANDPKMAEAAAAAKEGLAGINPDDLRKSAEVRASTLATAKSIVATFTPFARKFA
jgi:hypothetical protein